MNIVQRIIESKKREVDRLRGLVSIEELRYRIRGLPECRDFKSALTSEAVSIIAEVKKHSPSKGSLNDAIDPAQTAVLYETNGAVAISILTDHEYFHGSAEYLRAVRSVVKVPVLRKDFLIDPYQIYESRVMGADAVLLIVGILSETELKKYIRLSMSLGIWPLVEIHSPEDLRRALTAGAEIIGINNRDLSTFMTNITTTLNLFPLVPPAKIVVSESGIQTRHDIETMTKAGVHAFLIGEALMCAPDPGKKLKELRGQE